MHPLACCLVILRFSCKWGRQSVSVVVCLLHACWFERGPIRVPAGSASWSINTAAPAPLLTLTLAAPCIFLLLRALYYLVRACAFACID